MTGVLLIFSLLTLTDESPPDYPANLFTAINKPMYIISMGYFSLSAKRMIKCTV